MTALNIEQVYAANPITTNQALDLMYWGKYPYGITDDAAMTYQSFLAQLGGSLTESITGTEFQVLANNTYGIPQTGPVTLTLPQSIAITSAVEFASVQTQYIYDLTYNMKAAQFYNPSALSVNYLSIFGNTTGDSPGIVSIGSDSVIGFKVGTKGDATFTLNTVCVTQPPLLINSGTTSQHSTGFYFANTPGVKNITFPDATFTVAGTALTLGGTNAALTASNGGIVWSNATQLQILAGTATANLPLLSGSTATPAWGAFSLNLGGALTTAGALTLSGAFASTFTMTAGTSVIFPTTGTLATTSQLVTPAALTKTDDTNVTLTLGGSPTTALVNAASLTLGWTGTLSVARGGLGLGSTPTNGQIPIGNATNYTLSTLTAGTGVSITNGTGTITIAATGGTTVFNANASSIPMNVNTVYNTNNGASLVTYTLPATAVAGDYIEIIGASAGGWLVAQGAGQQIVVSPNVTTIGVGGSIASTSRYNSIVMRCVAANVGWSVTSQQSAGLTIV